MQIQLTIPGRLVGKGRPKFSVVNGHARAYTPEKARNAEAMIRTLAFEAMQGKPPCEGPMALTITVWINRPASWSKKRKAATTFVTGKPDADNQIKLTADSMNGIVYRDDAQISRLSIDRFYTDGAERATVKVESLAEEQAKRVAA
jgi:Holliday junction resolvase RusA-like endonuclease